MSENTITPAGAPEAPAAKTFTQEEVDTIIGKRLAKAMKGVPSEEEMSAYRAWKNSQQAEQQAKRDKELADSKTALNAAQMELEQLKRERYVLSKGFAGEEAEFIIFRAQKLVSDKTTFEQAVDQLTANRTETRFDWTAPAGAGQGPDKTNAAMNALIRGAFK